VIDCANGAAYRVAPTVLEELGAEVVAIGDQPDGFNINDGCGAMYTDLLRERVLREGAHAGIALDGDADRVIMVDELGAEVDGDRMMAILATHMKRSGLLRGDAVVGTVMSNLGLEVYLKEQGIGLLRANVGDRYVVEMMKETGCNLGGEQSGHLICLDNTTTGDGMISALSVLVAMQEADKPLSELHAAINRYPQVLINVAVQEKSDLAEEADICSAIDSAREALGEQGRVLVRYSGTQALARVMVEGAEHSAVEEHARAIADAIQARLG
jgi:phosphoglucosamine mutase